MCSHVNLFDEAWACQINSIEHAQADQIVESIEALICWTILRGSERDTAELSDKRSGNDMTMFVATH